MIRCLMLGLLCGAGCAEPSDDSGADVGTEAALDCEPGTRDGVTGASDNLTSPDGLRYNVRVPEDYDPTMAHPLLMVYAPAGAQADTTEQFTGLTLGGNATGYIVAYAQHISPRSVEGIEPLGRIPAAIAEQWCVDSDRIYLTGHSDGGTIASIIAIFDQMDGPPAAIAPSAAGIKASLLETLQCPAPLPVMVMHSRNDGLFPPSEGFGSGAANWWAACNSCDPTPGTPDGNNCAAYANCTDGAEVFYCNGSGSHGRWPGLNGPMYEFFEQHP
jgi:polyhydroxybutyrate depolymerase